LLEHSEWVIVGIIFLILPTILQLTTIYDALKGKWLKLFQELFIFMFQLHPLRSLKRSWETGVEDTDHCNLKLLEAVVEDVPQIILQMFATFILSQSEGWNSVVIISIVVSIFAMSQTLAMLLDRPILPENNEEIDENSSILKQLKKFFGLLLCLAGEGNDDLLELGGNLTSLGLFIFHFCQMTVRFVMVTWFLGVFRGVGFIVIGCLVLIRLSVAFTYYPRGIKLPASSKCLVSLYGTFIAGLWEPSGKNDENTASFITYIGLGILSSIENIMFMVIILLMGPKEYQFSHQTNLAACVIFGVLLFLQWVMDLTIRTPLLFRDEANDPEVELAKREKEKIEKEEEEIKGSIENEV